jgi:cyclic beta-1,2-glucan synthetase
LNQEKTILSDTLYSWQNAIRNNLEGSSGQDDELPLRSELFSAAQMAAHGKHLAARHQLSKRGGPDRLLARLAENADVISGTCAELTAAIKAGRQITPASEWLLDNFYLIEEQIRTARRHLPKDYSKELPRLANEEAEGNPRVYQIALEIISHGDGRVDPESLSRFVDAYQDIAPLKLGELWAIPIMLRIALIENLRRVAARVYENRTQRDRANTWADQMSETAEKNPSDLILLVADMARSRQPMTSGFVAELARRLQGQSSALTLALQWVTTRLADVGLTIEQQIQAEIQQQAADQVTISNSIGSLRFLGTMDWQEFVETMSAVEQTLRCDPADTYGKMDFATRDNYRHIVEQLAKRCDYTEVQVAEQALELAQANREPARGGLDLRTRHVGYYLVGAGLPALEKRLAVRYPPGATLAKLGRGAPLATYLGAIALFTALFTASVVLHAWEGGLEGGLLILLGVLAAIGSSQLALALVNFMATQLTRPHPLPRMDFKDGIPDDARTMVVVPSMLYSPDNVASLCEALEVRYLANRDPGLRFCLLTDFADAASETLPEDGELVALARATILQLNAKYHDPEGPGPVGLPTLDGQPDVEAPVEPFLLLHRPRLWSEGERAWIGVERKRGKLADLNAFLRGGARDKFSVVVGDTCGLQNIRYVITLDTDTQLPRDSARQFIATMAHPLNQPQLDAAGRRVIEGYGILQPRVTASLPSENASRYEHLCGGEPGIDPYTRTVSDVYQDVFYEGSFIGKGIYDVDTFEHLLGNRLPDNQILSHDLLEGCYLRAGLLSDAQLYETYPARYSDDVSRRHRWIRGDWQLAGWLLPRVPAANGKREPNPLSALSLWKLFDNLRRSVVAPVLTAMLLICWALLPAPWFWSAAVLSVIFVPTFVSALVGLVEKPHDMRWRQHLGAGFNSVKVMFGHAALQAVFLPYEAWFSLDAIVRTGWRMLVSRRNLLEWRPSGLARSSANMETNWQRMWFSPALAVGAAVMLSFVNPGALFAAAPVLLLWFMAPVVAWWISLPVERDGAELSSLQNLFLHTLARKTWSFFEDFVGAEDNWLPPDNMQEHPAWVIAHRTSPTNMGMSLLANLTAHDFGFATIEQVLARTGATFATMDRMERHHGHFYNWYDTITLTPLQPMYVSSVDSGNLAGHLLTLAPGLAALADQPIASAQTLYGISITLEVVKEYAGDGGEEVGVAIAALENLLAERMREARTLPGLADALTRLCKGADALLAAMAPAGEPHLQGWAEKLAAQCHSAHDELLELAPWMKAAHEYVVDSSLTRIPTLRELAGFALTGSPDSDLAPNERARQHTLAQLVDEGSAAAQRRLGQIADLAIRARQFADMDFSFLYNTTTNLLAIGYNVSERRLDTSCYDLLASEVRLASFVGIAQGQFPQEHWFALGRQLCIVGGEQLLLSWSGSMFEYLMPLLVMPTYQNTLLDQTYRAIINAQVDYSRQRGVPWGISESGYNTVDANLNYQYRAFGVPGTGMKRGLADDLVIAPYATMLGLMVDAEASCENLQRMHGLGFMGKYGFYEAIDYTTTRLPRGQDFAVIRSFMAHHQGMGFLALSYLLHDRPMQRRFESDPLFQATMLVLQERVPKAGAFHSHTADLAAMRAPVSEVSMPMRIITTASTAQPEVQLLSNGRYHVMVTSAGGSYSRWKDLSVTRWREDGTADNWGNFCYVRDVDSGQFWSTAFQPTLVEPKKYEVIFSEGRAEFRRHDKGLDLYTEIVVSPEDDIEMRRTRITNKSSVRRTIEFTSYAEVVMAPAAADNAHPAFSKLFVQTEILRNENAILCTRRPRTKDEHMPWLLNLMTVHDGVLLDASFETSRADFIGRANSTVAPRALLEPQPLGGGEGSVLDPIVAIRYKVTLDPDQVVTLDVVTGMTDTREAALHLIDKYQDRHLADRVFELAWTHSQVVLRQLNATESDAQLYSRLASSIIYPNAALRADASILIRNHRGQSGLWAYAISGDLPIVLMQIKDPANIDLARQMVQAHAYWRLKGLVVDLVIWYEDNSGYRQALHDQIMGLIASGIDAQAIDRPGGIFVRLLDQISNEDRVLMQSVARAILSDARGSLADQIKRAAPVVPKLPLGVFEPRAEPYQLLSARVGKPSPDLGLILDNGTGGFSTDGREYVITTDGATRTPAPWVNVLANPSFGSVVSESGQAYTWSENAHEFRLTPWDNDPVADSGGEAFYIRDEQTGKFWSPTALPIRAKGEFTTRHGFGYSVFEHAEEAIHSELLTYVALDAPIKYSVIKLRNDSTVPRKLSVTGYVEWVLGDLRPKQAMHVVTELDPLSGALFARNAYNTEFTGRVGFFQVEAQNRSVTADRNEFIGRNRNLANPAAMNRARLSGKVGAGLDPCAAIQVVIELQPGQERELVFMLGVGGRRNADASGLVQRYNGSAAAAAAFDMVRDHWDATLGAVRVETPEPMLDVIANGWLMYQTIACRMWARSGYYQLCAAHQFVEGDVQHWWHPPSDRGVRTHCSDDYLWLPLATHRYVIGTGDHSVLTEPAPFLEGRMLAPEEESYYDMPGHSHQNADLYEHCVRAIKRGLRFGEHGLPLIGTCDWNDGMDRVGNEGKGESVWLAWFLFDVLTKFADVAVLHDDQAFADTCRNEAKQLAANVEQHAWDGKWYRRAYFDDGTPLGSSSNDECQIDSISQSWGVLSGAADPARTASAMAAVDARLVRRDFGLVQLLDPPFDKGVLNPGYIRGYVPGVRENGGQYTHAAIWTAMAFAKMGDSAKAWELLRMINPVNHSASPEGSALYKVEPYVVAADVYAVSPHIGRGGWSWYTGSSGWMYRLIVESLLGLGLAGDQLTIAPHLPAEWDGFKLHYRYRTANYTITVAPGASAALTLDGRALEGNAITLVDDGHEHVVQLQVVRATM